MNITVIGHGNVGGTLALRFAEAGHSVTVGAADAQSESLRGLLAQHPHLQAKPLAQAAQGANVVLLATPAAAVPQVAAQLAPPPGAVLVDATNAFAPLPGGHPTAFHCLSEAFPHAQVVKAFNSTGFENMRNPQFAPGLAADMFMAGDSAQAKATVRQLAQEIGFAECYDFGTAAQVPLLEAFAKSWINLALAQGLGRGLVLKLFRR